MLYKYDIDVSVLYSSSCSTSVVDMRNSFRIMRQKKVFSKSSKIAELDLNQAYNIVFFVP